MELGKKSILDGLGLALSGSVAETSAPPEEGIGGYIWPRRKASINARGCYSKMTRSRKPTWSKRERDVRLLHPDSHCIAGNVTGDHKYRNLAR